MAELISILGESGTGKSRSIKNLDPAKTLVINVADKRLPFRNTYTKLNSKEKSGNMVSVNTRVDIEKAITFAEQNMNFDTYVIDDKIWMSSLNPVNLGKSIRR